MFLNCSHVTILLFLFVLTFSETHGNVNVYRFSFSELLPQKSDLAVYLECIERIIEFCTKNKNELDLNFEFGLFLINVNLKSIIEKKGDNLPKRLHGFIQILLRTNDDLIDFFKNMVKNNHDSREKGNKRIISLFANEDQWTAEVSTFLVKPLTQELHNFKLLPWLLYIETVDDVDNSVPSPEISDMCMISLASNRVHRSGNAKCLILEPCYDMLINGSDYGYALSHRLLFMLNARFGRGCNIFSDEEDRDMIKTFCDVSYQEAEYIANHSFGVVDLILEQISLCSLDGHAHFLQRHWLSNILRFQTSYGCFGLTRINPKLSSYSKIWKTNYGNYTSPKIWKLAKHRDHEIMGGLCNGHVTSVAAAAFAAAVRYILEVYY